MENDNQKVRLFVAVFPTREVVERVEEAVDSLKKSLGARAVRWTLPEQMHLTLAFIGYVEQGRVGQFESALGAVAQKNRGCVLESSGVGCFPDVRRPRVLWAGLTGEVKPLQDLQKDVERTLQGLGYVPEERAFHPHLTLGRVNSMNSRERQALGEFLESFKNFQFGRWHVNRIDLMQSVLSAHGAKYSTIKSEGLLEGA